MRFIHSRVCFSGASDTSKRFTRGRKYNLLKHARSGFTMVECVVAILVINLTIAGMFKLLKLQEKQVAENEGWLKKNPIYYLNPDPEPLARALGKPASLDESPMARGWKPDSLPYTVRIIDYRFELDPAVLRVEFEQREAETEEAGNKDKKEDRKEMPEKSSDRLKVEGNDVLRAGQSRMRRNEKKESKSGSNKKRRPRS